MANDCYLRFAKSSVKLPYQGIEGWHACTGAVISNQKPFDISVEIRSDFWKNMPEPYKVWHDRILELGGIEREGDFVNFKQVKGNILHLLVMLLRCPLEEMHYRDIYKKFYPDKPPFSLDMLPKMLEENDGDPLQAAVTADESEVMARNNHGVSYVGRIYDTKNKQTERILKVFSLKKAIEDLQTINVGINDGWWAKRIRVGLVSQ